MSVSAMANAALARRPDFPPSERVPVNLREIAAAAETPGAPANAATAALDAIVTYIPTEILTLYVAVIAALRPTGSSPSGSETAFWLFLGATPVVVWLVYAAKLKIAGKAFPVRPAQWPLWEMVAAAIAYGAWALALPDNAVAARWGYPEPLAGVIVLIAGALLALLAPLFQRPLAT